MSDIVVVRQRLALEPLSPDARDTLAAAFAQDEARRQLSPEPEPAAKAAAAEEPKPAAQATGEAPPVAQAALPTPPPPPEASAPAEPTVTASLPAHAAIEPPSPIASRPARRVRAATAPPATPKFKLSETSLRKAAALPSARRSPDKPAAAGSAPAWSLPRALQPTE